MTSGGRASGPRSSVLDVVSATARRLPKSRTKSRLGRATAYVLVKFGADPLVRVHTPQGTFMLDARSRTESGMLWNEVYDEDDIAFLRAVTPAEGTFVDIGANVGLIFIPVARTMSGAGRAVAVEPVPVNFARLTQACSLNDEGAGPTLVNVAVGREPGTLTLVKEGHPSSSENAVPALEGQTGISVPLVTLDALVQEQGLTQLDTIKVDVEGFEVDVFMGAKETLREFRPVVYGEFNNGLMPLRGVSFHDVWDLFRPLDYRCYSFLARLHLVERPQPPSDLGNVVLIPSERVEILRGRGVRIDA